ncbi:MAG: hypothetical protein ABEH38_08075 [Flavobacteriales bacterium]
MRRSILISFFSIALFIGVGCGKSNCEDCKKVTYENGQKVSEGSEEEYCGDELEEKKNYEKKVGNRREEYECS